MEPKSVNTTVSSVLQIAPGASSPDGSESTVLDFAQVILASQGDTGAGAEQRQHKKHATSEAASDPNSNPDEALVVSGDPLALKLFRPKAGLTQVEGVVAEAPTLATLSQVAGQTTGPAIDPSALDITLDAATLPAGPDAILPLDAELATNQQVLVEVGSVIAPANKSVAEPSAASSPDELTGIVPASTSVLEVNQDASLAVSGGATATVTPQTSAITNRVTQSDAQIVESPEGQISAQDISRPLNSAGAHAPIVTDAVGPEVLVGAADAKQSGLIENTAKPAVGESTVALSSAAAITKPSLTMVAEGTPTRKIAVGDKSIAVMPKLALGTNPAQLGKAVGTAKAEPTVKSQTPMTSAADGVEKSPILAAKAPDVGAKVPEVSVQAPDIGSAKSTEEAAPQTDLSKPDHSASRLAETGRAGAVNVAATQVEPAVIKSVVVAEIDAKSVGASAAPKTLVVPADDADTAPVSAPQGQKVSQADVGQKASANPAELGVDKSDDMAVAEKPLVKAKINQKLVNTKGSKIPQTTELNAPLRADSKAIAAPVIATQATVAKQSTEAVTQAVPVQADIASQMKRSMESKTAERKTDLEGLDEKLKETVIEQRPQKAAPALEARVLRSAQIDATAPLPAEHAETVEITEAEQTLNEIMAPVTAGSGQPQTGAANVVNTLIPSQNLAALERWGNSIVDVQKQGWTQSLVRRVAAMPTNGGSLVITLQPASLGKITVSLSESRRGIDLRMRTETGATAALLNDAEGRISQLLESAGMRLNSFSADTSGSFAENNKNSDKLNSKEQPDGQSDLDLAQQLPENAEQSIARQGDGLVNVIA